MADQEDIAQRYRRSVTQYISGLKPLKWTPMGITTAMYNLHKALNYLIYFRKLLRLRK